MGLASFFEDNQDATGEVARVIKKEFPNDSKPNGDKLLMHSTLEEEEILIEQVESPCLTIEEWVECVKDCYVKDGEELPKGDLKTLVAKALIVLCHKGYARQISLDRSSGKWKIGRNI